MLGNVGIVTGVKLVSKVSSLTDDVSLKDGYADRSKDVVQACKENLVELTIVGRILAGGEW
ncbi:MAG TPA: hypothetical protein VJ965_04430 [Anaerolineales bacterium]|nr:hypothetical protein [Anaerolineales bacterium]